MRCMENRMKRFPLLLCVAAVLALTFPTSALAEKALHVYCGAGMTKPFGEIAAVTQWMGLMALIGQPAAMHPKRPILGLPARAPR